MIARACMLAIFGSMLLGSAAHAGGGAAPSQGGGETADLPGNVHVSSYALPNDLAVQAQAASDAFAPPEEGRYIDLPSMNVPVVRSGQLMGYAFIIVRVHFNSGVDDWRVREMSHHMLDSAVRAVHRAPFSYAGRDAYDDSATHAAIIETLSEYLPPEGLKSIELLGGDVRLLAR